MEERDQIDYRQMEAGFEFPPARYRVDSSAVRAYLATVEEDNSLYVDSGLVPPMAIAAQALAAIYGRDYIIPDDVKRLMPVTLRHRLILKPESQLRGHTPDTILQDVMQRVELDIGEREFR